MNPKHENPRRAERTAHAPYNFVPLPEKIVLAEPVPDQDRYYHDRFTGHIECTLTTESPLYTRTALNPEFFRQWADDIRRVMENNQTRAQYAQFFHLDDLERPIIPASSLRGMIRFLVEIVGYGKIQWVTKEPLVFRAVGDTTSLGKTYRNRMQPSLLQAGYLERQGQDWQIRPAQPIAGNAFARIKHTDVPWDELTSWKGCKNAKSIYVPIRSMKKERTPLFSSVSAQPKKDLQEAVLVKTGPMQGKKKDFVFGLPDEKATPIKIPDETVRDYRNQITPGQEAFLGKGGALQEMQPVFYLVENGKLTFFGHAMMFRLPYHNTPLDFVPEHLRRESDLDLAEAIFGYTKSKAIPEGKERAYAGRVFFTDARFQSAAGGVWLSTEPITPKILSSPKPTTFQHYLTQDQPDDKRSLNHYASEFSKTVIRGHKLYWHKGPVGQGNIQESETIDWSEDSQHTQIKPVKAGVIFRYRIYFENLSEVELGALLWALVLPGETNKEYRHKLGMGKPLGMGSVKINPTLYLSNRRSRYTQLFEGESWHRAERPEQNVQRFIEAFENYILNAMDKTERGEKQSLKDVKRIKMLLKMLEWRGPNRQLIEYMHIEPNEYKDRPVLPDPLAVELAASSTFKSSKLAQKGKSKGKKRRK